MIDCELESTMQMTPEPATSSESSHGGFAAWLQRVRRSGEYSDVTVEVDGQELHLHLLPLLNASTYFRTLTANPNWPRSPTTARTENGDVGARKVSLTGLPGGLEGFAAAVDYCYLIKPSFGVESVARVRVAAEYLGMADVMESTKKFLYATVFAHWRASAAYLQRGHAPVDEYIETRCLKVVVAALARAFGETKYLAAPMARGGGGGGGSSAPCEALAEILARAASLPDAYACEALDALVEADVNLSVKCRQGRNVRSWLASVVDGECDRRARCWMVLCLARMLVRNAPQCRPWLELASQYWCSLLEHVERLVGDVAVADDDGVDDDVDHLEMQMKLEDVKRTLERRVGASLDELDEDLHSYDFTPETLLTMVSSYLEHALPDATPESVAEVASEVETFLWRYAEPGTSITTDTFLSLCTAFPRHSHDSTFNAIQKLLTSRPDLETSPGDRQRLWRIVDPARLSPAVRERAVGNPGFLSQPHVLEVVLRQHREELEEVDSSVPSLRPVMQKVISASLKLLEENARRSREVAVLQHEFSALEIMRSCESSPASWVTITQMSSSVVLEGDRTETDSEVDSEMASVATVSSIADQPRLDLRDLYSLESYKKRPHLKSVD